MRIKKGLKNYLYTHNMNNIYNKYLQMQQVQSTAFESYHDSIWKVFWSTINIRDMQQFKVAIRNLQSIKL